LAVRDPIVSERQERHTEPRRRASRGALLSVFLVLAIVVIGAIAFGLRPRLARGKALAAASEAIEEKLPVVNVAPARQSPAKTELELPGDLQAEIETPIFARADGYLHKRLVDIGDHVHKDELLAEIDTPELDQQLSQARAGLAQAQASLVQLQANLVQARANLKLAQVTWERWSRLADRGVYSRQDADEKQAAFEARKADVDAAIANAEATRKLVDANIANVHRLEELKGFASVVAPFDGVVTNRNMTMDPGTLVNSGNGGTNREIFRVAQIQTMRIFVNVPQAYAALVHDGLRAELRVQELPGQMFPATVIRNAHSVDASARTMLAILETPNPKGVLLPGMYAQVKFAFSGNKSGLLIPGDALLLGREGPRVAVAAPDHTVHMRRIHVAHDFGADLEIDSGLAPGDMVVLNPTDEIRENARVEVRTAAQ
jgi:RND family efflux transporter MFP subunit